MLMPIPLLSLGQLQLLHLQVCLPAFFSFSFSFLLPSFLPSLLPPFLPFKGLFIYLSQSYRERENQGDISYADLLSKWPGQNEESDASSKFPTWGTGTQTLELSSAVVSGPTAVEVDWKWSSRAWLYWFCHKTGSSPQLFSKQFPSPPCERSYLISDPLFSLFCFMWHASVGARGHKGESDNL